MSNLGLISLISNKELEKIVQSRPDVKVGDRIEGKILKKNPDGKVLVDFGKFQSNVELKAPIEEGDVIRLLVVEKGKQLKLKLEHPELKVNENGRSSIQLPDPGKEKTIEELFSKIDTLLQKRVRPDGAQKPENILKDIKQELGKLKEHVEASRGQKPLPKELRRDVEKLLENVEKTLRRLPDSPKSLEKLEAVSKDIRQLRETVETVQQKIQRPASSEIDAAVKTAVKTAEKTIARAAETIESLPQVKEAPAPPKAPPPESQKVHDGREVREVREVASRQAPEPPPETRAVDKLTQQAVDRAAQNAKEMLPAVRTAADETVKLDQLMAAGQTRELIPPRTRENVESFLKDLTLRLDSYNKTPERPPAPENIEAVGRAVRNLNASVRTNRDYVELRDRIVKQVELLKELAEQYRDHPAKKEIDAAIEKLAETAGKIARIKNPEQLTQLKRLVAEEIKPRLAELNRVLEREPGIKPPADSPETGKAPEINQDNRQISREMRQHVELLQKDIDITLKQNPAPPRAIDAMVRIAERALSKIPPVDIPAERPPAEAPPAPKPQAQPIEISPLELRELKINIPEINTAAQETVKLEELIKSSQTRESLQPKTLEHVETLVNQMTARVQSAAAEYAPAETTAAQTAAQTEAQAAAQTEAQAPVQQKIQIEPRFLQQLDSMTRAARNIRTSVEVNRDFIELRDRIVKQVQEIKELAEKYPDLANKKDVDAAIEKLSEAAQKISQMKSPDQLAELKRVVAEEIKPRLAELKEYTEQTEYKKAETVQRTVTPEQRPAVEEMNRQVEQLSRDIDLTLKKAPSPPRALDAMVRIAERAVSRVPLPPEIQLAETQPQTVPAGETRPVSQPLPPESVLTQSAPPVPPSPEQVAAAAESIDTISRDAAQLRDMLQAPRQSDHIPPQDRAQIESLLQHIGDRLTRLPSTQQVSDPVEVSKHLESLARSVQNLRDTASVNRDWFQVKDEVVKQVLELKALAEKSDLPFKKELEVIINKLSRSIEKLEQIKSPEQLPELRKILAQEIKPGLNELREVVRPEISKLPPQSEGREIVREIADRASVLSRNVDQALSNPPIEPRELEALIKIADKAMRQVPQAPEPPRGTAPPPADTTARADGAEMNRVEMSRAEISRSEINQDVARLKELVQPAETRQSLPPQLQKDVEALLRTVDLTLEPLSRSTAAKPPPQIQVERLDPLYQSVNQLRTTLDVNREFLETREQIIKLAAQLELIQKNAEPPLNKELQTAVKQLAEVADNVRQLRTPDQLPELKQLINEQVKPRLADVGREIAAQINSTPPGSESGKVLNESLNNVLKDIGQQVQTVRETVDRVAAQPPAPASEIDALMKSVEKALARVNEPVPAQTAPAPAEAPAQAAQPQFSESIQDLYENIKAALKLLQSRLSISGDNLEMPPEIKNIFTNLQSDIQTAGASEQVLNQLPQLKALFENLGLPFEKINVEVLKALDEIFQQIGQLREQHQFGEIRNVMQNRLTSHLNMIEEIVNDPFMLAKSDNPGAASKAQGVIDTIRAAIEGALAKAGEGAPASELSELSQLSQKLADLSKTIKPGNNVQDLKASENIANLSRNIEELLSQLPDKALETGNGAALVSKVKTMLSTLHSHVEPLDIGDSAIKLAPKLKSLVKDSGVFFEKKLHDMIDQFSKVSERLQSIQKVDQLPEVRSIIDSDLKPNLLQLKEFLNDQRITSQLGKSPALDSVREAVEEMINNINSQQEHAVEQQQQPNQPPVQAFSFQIPIKGEELGELKVFYNRGRDKDSPDEFKLSLLLEMDKIGEIRSDFFNIKKDLTITFYVRDSNVKDFMDDNVEELEQALQPVFENVSVQTVVSREKAAAFEPEEPETEIISDSAVNVKV